MPLTIEQIDARDAKRRAAAAQPAPDPNASPYPFEPGFDLHGIADGQTIVYDEASRRMVPANSGEVGRIAAWTTGATYTTGQIVVDSGILYQAVDDHTAGATFSGDSAHWTQLDSETDGLALAQLATHAADTTGIHGIADTAALVLTGDSRLSNARVPTAHKTSHATGGSDALTPADIGAATPASVTAEATARASADTAEVTARTAAIGAEATTRADADTAETAARIAADTSEATTRAAADTAETAARVAADALKADLVGGFVPTSQLPAISTNVPVTVASQAAMLALTTAQVQPGDVAIRTDLSGHRFLLADPDPSVLGHWIAMETPDAVTSVNGQAGTVVLAAADVGAATPASVTAEATARANADTSEATARAAADTTESAARVTGDALAAQRASNGSDFADAGTVRYNLHDSALKPAACIATANVASRSGLGTFDGHTLVDGEAILLTAQTTASQNGPWIAHSGSWTRPTDFPAAGVVTARTIAIVSGTIHAKELWLLQTNGSITVDTTSQVWVQAGGASGFDAVIVAGSPVGGTATVDFAHEPSTQYRFDLTVNHALTTQNFDEGARIVLELKQPAGGNCTLGVDGTDVPIDMAPNAPSTVLLFTHDGVLRWITGQKGDKGDAGGAITIAYIFDSVTTDADPGAGKLRLSNGTQNAAVTIRADLNDALGSSWASVLDTFDDSTSTVKGHIRLQSLTHPASFLLYEVTAVAAPAGYRNISVTNIGGSATSPLTNGEAVQLMFTRTGDAGTGGGGGGTLALVDGGNATSTYGSVFDIDGGSA